MVLQKRLLPVVIMGIFWGIIGLSMMSGIWEAKVPAEEVSVEVPSDIKGWMNLEDVSGYFDIPVNQVKEIFGMPTETDAATPLKDLAGEMGKETDEFKDQLSKYLGITETGTADSSNNGTSVTQPASTGESQSSGTNGGEEEPKGEGTGSEETIKGRMTFKEVEYQTKVPVSYICGKLGIPDDVDQNVPLKNLAEQFDFEVDEIRVIVEEYK